MYTTVFYTVPIIKANQSDLLGEGHVQLGRVGRRWVDGHIKLVHLVLDELLRQRAALLSPSRCTTAICRCMSRTSQQRAPPSAARWSARQPASTVMFESL